MKRLLFFLFLGPLSMSAQNCHLVDDAAQPIFDEIGVALRTERCENTALFYPNPTPDGIWCRDTEGVLLRGNWQVWDMIGRIVQTAIGDTIDISVLAQGSYRVCLTANGRVYMGRIIKL